MVDFSDIYLIVILIACVFYAIVNVILWVEVAYRTAADILIPRLAGWLEARRSGK